MKRLFLSLLMVSAAVIGIHAQQQHISIHQTTGDSLQYNLISSPQLVPEVRDGKVVWSFQHYIDTDGDGGGDTLEEMFAVEDVEDITFRSEAYNAAESRKALMEFYEATDGDHWSNHTNWGSDKPLSEWYGVSAIGSFLTGLDIRANNLKGDFPDCFAAIPLINIWISNHKELTGNLPLKTLKNPSLVSFEVGSNQLTGSIPEDIGNHQLKILSLSGNNLTGVIPASLVNFMDWNAKGSGSLSIQGNNLSGKVPEEIVKHERFPLLWDYIVPQHGLLEMPTIPGPEYIMENMNGSMVNTKEVYAQNEYTLIYNYAPYSGELTDKIIQAFNTYREKGFEVIGLSNPSAESLEEWLHNNDVGWINFAHDAWKKYFTHYYLIPVIHVVDRQGNIVFTSLMDDKGVWQAGNESTTYYKEVFPFLEDKFGKIEYHYYTSTDYSKDGEVMTLQKATVGEGVDLVFLGNGFVDKDMDENGKYEKRMKEAMEQFFSYEPYTSLRNRFNVYTVKAVSANAEFSEGSSHAINKNDDAKAFEYAQKIPGLIENRPMRVIVVYNSWDAGRSYCTMHDDASFVAYVMDGVCRTLNHEAGGHGVGRLLDEYTEFGYESSSPSEEYITYMNEDQWKIYGRGANIDFTNDLTKVKWAKFINDERYAAEGLGAFEGAGTYGYGCYRPTWGSMMQYNNYPFNAPSREAIYKYVMQESEGAGWTYDYETFVAFDEKGRAEYTNALNQASRKAIKMNKQQQRMTAPPVFVKGTWRDAMKK